jgi:hypothetical protein
MRAPLKQNIGVVFLLVATLLAAAPIPFLAGPDSSAIFDRTVRVGQAIVTPRFNDVSGLSVQKTSSVYAIEGVTFQLEAIRNLPYDEIEAISVASKEPWVTAKFQSSSRVLFDGWSPTLLPVRISYKYFALIAALTFAVGLYSLVIRRHQESERDGISTLGVFTQPWVTIPKEIATSHPKFGIRRLAAFFRAMLVITPGLWLFGSIDDLATIIQVRGSLTNADFVLVAPKVIFFVWSGWNANLLGKHDQRFYVSFFGFLLLGPVIIIASNLFWLANSGIQFTTNEVADDFVALLVAWGFWSAVMVVYVQFSKRINVTLRNRVRATDPLASRIGG